MRSFVAIAAPLALVLVLSASPPAVAQSDGPGARGESEPRRDPLAGPRAHRHPPRPADEVGADDEMDKPPPEMDQPPPKDGDGPRRPDAFGRRPGRWGRP